MALNGLLYAAVPLRTYTLTLYTCETLYVCFTYIPTYNIIHDDSDSRSSCSIQQQQQYSVG